MKSQDDIIKSTEMVMEKCRQKMAQLKANVSSPLFKICCVSLENLLFEFTVLFYTHRTIWTQRQFWDDYATCDDPEAFAGSSYDRMKQATLVNSYSKLYFYIEGALKQYYLVTDQKISKGKKSEGEIIYMYDQLPRSILQNHVDLKNGFKILRYVRNSFHGDQGNFIFKYENEDISFKGESYSFFQNKAVLVSYKFLRDFIPCISDFYISLFAKNH